jgi:carbon monoxide dehydrogenase subunit G
MSLLVLLLILTAPVGAESLEQLKVSHQRGVYRLSADLLIDAPLAAVRARLTDYDALTALSPSIRESRELPAPPGYQARVETQIDACVAMLCRRLHRVEDVRERGDRLIAEIVPARGNFRAGRTEWLLIPRGEQVEVRYRAWLEPAFAVPPVLGPALVKQGLEQALRETLKRLEQLAGG